MTYEAGTIDAKQATARLLVENVQTVYSGKPNTCRCGCAGTYRYHPLKLETVGRTLEAKDVNLSQVTKVVRLLLSHIDEVEVIEESTQLIFDVQVGNRVYTAYVPKQ